MKEAIAVSFRDYSVVFSTKNGGFPEKIVQNLRSGAKEAVVNGDLPWLQLQLQDGTVAYPAMPEDQEPYLRTGADGTAYLRFNGIPLASGGKALPDWALDLTYELHSDGVGFLSATLINDGREKPDVGDLKLCIPMYFGEDRNILYHYWMRPQETNGGDIQAYSDRYRNEQPAGKNLAIPGTILPVVGFDFGKPGRLYRHMEWFVESQTSLDESDPENTCTRLDWTQGEPVLTYSFAAKGVKANGCPYIWTNRLGFVLTQTPKVRDKAPLRVYHWVDGYDRYPTDRQIRKMALEGADMLILHESWRRNMRGGGAPHDESRFLRVIETCHRYHLRVAPYIRGDEDSLREDGCAWFDWYFRKNYDGLYVDYGGPQCYFEKNAVHCDGRIAFHQHYRAIASVRERVGKDGIVVLHIGPFFSGAVVASLVDGFCSGECEQGKMIEDRQAHAYYAKTAIGPGSLWTAAFPAYRTRKILPYAAVTGQFPHVTLGVQISSSSLANPREPGAVTFMRPLWRFFGLMHAERDIAFANDICDDTIRCDSPLTGAGMYTMQDGSRLLLIGNFAGTARLCTVAGSALPRRGQPCRLLQATEQACSIADAFPDGSLSVTLPAYGVAGLLTCPDNEKWRDRLCEFVKPYPSPDKQDLAYERSVARMKSLRFDTLHGRQLYLKLYIPFSNPTWEKPLWDDLYETTLYRLSAVSGSGERRDMGYLSKAGLTRSVPESGDRPWQTESSPWIALHTLLEPGCWNLEIHACRADQDYYCLAQALVKTAPDGNPAVLAYMGELDEDRSRLTFRINLQK